MYRPAEPIPVSSRHLMINLLLPLSYYIQPLIITSPTHSKPHYALLHTQRVTYLTCAPNSRSSKQVLFQPPLVLFIDVKGMTLAEGHSSWAGGPLKLGRRPIIVGPPAHRAKTRRFENGTAIASRMSIMTLLYYGPA